VGCPGRRWPQHMFCREIIVDRGCSRFLVVVGVEDDMQFAVGLLAGPLFLVCGARSCCGCSCCSRRRRCHRRCCSSATAKKTADIWFSAHCGRVCRRSLKSIETGGSSGWALIAHRRRKSRMMLPFRSARGASSRSRAPRRARCADAAWPHHLEAADRRRTTSFCTEEAFATPRPCSTGRSFGYAATRNRGRRRCPACRLTKNGPVL